MPSEGGLVTFGELVVHDIERDVAARHRLRFDLPPGWVPEDVDDDRWAYGLVSLAFLDNEHLELGVPDGSGVTLRLPAPGDVLLPTPRPGVQR